MMDVMRHCNDCNVCFSIDVKNNVHETMDVAFCGFSQVFGVVNDKGFVDSSPLWFQGLGISLGLAAFLGCPG